MVSNDLLSYAAQKYDFDIESLHFISDSTNQIYVFKKGEEAYILRFGCHPAEYVHQTKAEMDWLYYLAKNGIGVSLPLKTVDDELVVSVEDDGENYVITAFKMVSGRFWDKNDSERWNSKVFYNWGKLMGDIHRLTKDYKPANDKDVRSSFTGRDSLGDEVKTCPTVNRTVEDLISEIMDLPKDKDSYGLIHYDIHQWNFYLDGDKINVFDFDDSLFGWFALDIGIALYHGLWWGRKNDAGHDFTEEIIENFLKGYLSANDLSEFWLSKIPLFMKFRQICKFSWFYDTENVDDHQKERIRNIENGVLFTDCVVDTGLFEKKRYLVI